MAEKMCPLGQWGEYNCVSGHLNGRVCIDACAWWTGDRCAVVPAPMEVLTAEESMETSVHLSVGGPDQGAVVQALAAALKGKLL